LYSYYACCGPGAHRDLPSFPTRRSSDLCRAASRPDTDNPARPGSAPARLRRPRLRSSQRAKIAASSWNALNSSALPDGSRKKNRSEEHTSELQSRENLVCRLLLEKKKKN